MSRLVRKPLVIPKSVQVTQQAGVVNIKGSKGEFAHKIYPGINVEIAEDKINITAADNLDNQAMLGTSWILLYNYLHGVSQGFERRLKLEGVGYRAKATGQQLELSLGKSHQDYVNFPNDVTVETPSATEIVLKGADKQKLGQLASNIRALRPPSLYKGKGVRYAGEHIELKETKKK